MKVAIINDIHWGVRNNSDFFLDRYVEFFRDTFFPALDQRGIDTVWILGDTFDDRRELDPRTLAYARAHMFDPLAERGIKVVIIYGNHDVYYKNTNQFNTIDLFGDIYPNVHVVKTHEVIEHDGTPVGFISWINNDNLEDSLAWMSTVQCPILCGHFEIKTFQMTKGQTCLHGFDKSVFTRFERVISGHFHCVSDDGRIFYPSNPFQTTWGDYGLEKGFRIFDTRTREFEFVKNPVDLYEKFWFDEATNILEFDYSQLANKHVRVYVEQFPAPGVQNRVHLFLEELSKHAYQVVLEEVAEDMIHFEKLKAGDTFDNADTAQVVQAYIDETIQENSALEKDRLNLVFMSLYEEAMALSINTESDE